jgi:ribosomal protein S18 acetylase RimI-like enzyme
MDIRLVRPDEYEKLGDLSVEAYGDGYASAGLELPFWYVDELRDVAGRAVDAQVLVAVDGDGALLGGITFVPGPESASAEFDEADHAGIRMLAVAPTAQGRGVGDALSRACVERARAAGKAHLVLHSADWMTAAHRIYHRIGFERVPSLDWEPPLAGFWLRGFRLEL